MDRLYEDDDENVAPSKDDSYLDSTQGDNSQNEFENKSNLEEEDKDNERTSQKTVRVMRRKKFQKRLCFRSPGSKNFPNSYSNHFEKMLPLSRVLRGAQQNLFPIEQLSASASSIPDIKRESFKIILLFDPVSPLHCPKSDNPLFFHSCTFPKSYEDLKQEFFI